MIQHVRMSFRALPILFASLLTCAAPAVARSSAQSSPSDREHFVQITTNLEKAPLDPRLKHDRQWAMRWLIEAPDISVKACLASLGGVSQDDYSHGVEIIAQYTFSMARLTIQHPDLANNEEEQQLAGVEGALNAYQSMLKSEPAGRSAVLDQLLDLQSQGKLRDFVRGVLPDCSGPGEAIQP